MGASKVLFFPGTLSMLTEIDFSIEIILTASTLAIRYRNHLLLFRFRLQCIDRRSRRLTDIAPVENE